MTALRITKIALLGFLLTTITGCVVREERVVERPRGPGCRGGVWVDAHRGPHGHWHPGHWRCPGIVERIEID